MKLALIVSDSHVARAAGDALRAKYDFVPVREAMRRDLMGQLVFGP
jgi:NAD+ kinase